jgi:anthranilate phosphoribosyltransferase
MSEDTMNNMTHYLNQLLKKNSLTRDETKQAIAQLLQHPSAEQFAAFFTLLKFRGETMEEIVGIIEAVEEHSDRINLNYPVLDIVGTGGDCANTVNISTGSAILTAACGVSVVKHGNRSVSSLCGSADVLEEMGVNIDMSAESVDACVKKNNIAFLYAPQYHRALKQLRQFRQGLKIPTIFNLICPLLNPAHPEYALIGVADESLLEKITDVALKLNRFKSALIYHGTGLDELTPIGKATAYSIVNGKKEKMIIDPVELGFSLCTLRDLQGGDKRLNATLLHDALSGKPGAIADSFILNAAVALKLAGKVADFSQGIMEAKCVLNQGKAIDLLKKWSAFSNEASLVRSA